MKSIFNKVDCIRFYVSDIKEGLNYYVQEMGLKVIWKTDTAIGLSMEGDVTEIVIQNEDNVTEVDFLVESVIDALPKIKNAGGKVITGPFDIKIGKCALIEDPWRNHYAILDSTKGTFITDEEGRIIGLNRND